MSIETGKIPACPTCGQQDQVAKVSTLYLTAIGLNRLPGRSQPSGSSNEIHADLDPDANNLQPGTSAGLQVSAISGSELKIISRKIKPPASPKQAFNRPVHPDTVVLSFSLLVPFFIFGILQSQASMLIPMIIILVVAYGLYIWQRKKIIQRFNLNLAEKTAAEKRIRRALDRWMHLYYCLRDDVVFQPDDGQATPVDLIHGYLVEE